MVITGKFRGSRVSPAQSPSNQEAVALANDYGAEILFDAQAATPHFNYSDGLSSPEVWFEDARSVRTKLSLASRFRPSRNRDLERDALVSAALVHTERAV